MPASYTVSGTGPNGATFTKSTSGTSVTASSLALGSWTVTVNAYNSDSPTPTLIGSGSATAQVASAATTTLSISVIPLTGTGTLYLQANWTSGLVQTPSISASLTPASGSAVSLPFAIVGNQGSSSTSGLASGYGTLSLNLLDNGNSVMGAIEVVRIVAGQTTSGNFAFANTNQPGGSIQVTVSQNMATPLNVSISGATATLPQGNTETLTASVSNYTGSPSYVWYVNGVSAGTGTTYVFGTTQGIGTYRIDVAAFSADGTQAGSTSTSIQVTGVAGAVTTLASGFNAPFALASDGTNLYVADSANNRILKIVISTGTVSTLAGSTASGNKDGTGAAAKFNNPSGIVIDSSGTNLYVADTNNYLIRKIVINTGVVTTFAGTGNYGNANGTGTNASFSSLYGLATDGTNLYAADINNGIRKIVTSTAVVTTLTSNVSGPEGVATDGTYVYVACNYSSLIQKIAISNGTVTTLAGMGYGSNDGTGTAAGFTKPVGLAIAGNILYVADTGNNMIRKIVISTAAVTTLAGSTTSGSTNGTGTAASFKSPSALACYGSTPTQLFVADTGNNLIREIQ